MNDYFNQCKLLYSHYLCVRAFSSTCELGGATSGLELSVAWSSLSRLGCLTSEPQGSPVIAFPALGLQVPPHLEFFTCVQGPTQDFIIVRQTLIA